jgi:PadR family transcriptional regulator PadR
MYIIYVYFTEERTMKILTIFEQIILASIISLEGNAYGVSIRKRAKDLSGKSIMYGALYNVLDQLHKKGFVTRVKRTPTPEEGGHEKIFYNVTPSGLKAIKEAQAIQNAIQDSLCAYINKE